MKIDILTLFPQMFAPLGESIIKRATEKQIVQINITDIRDYTTDKHHLTDEKLYGGGAGMVMKPDPIFTAVEACQTSPKARIIVTSPSGVPFSQSLAQELAGEEQLIFICGHYEGIDQRVIDYLATDVISVGDFVLTGGELPAMTMVDAVVRLLPGALGDERSAIDESFSEDLLEYPQYTRPPVFREMAVPDVLMGGNHQEINTWRRQQSLLTTWKYRADLLEKAALTTADKIFLEDLDQKQKKPFNIFVALLHYPVYNKKHQTVNTSLTNLDLHDIARAARTFDVDKYYIVQPAELQRELIGKLMEHWQSGFGAVYNPDRHEALSRVALMESFSLVLEDIKAQYGEDVQIISTSAKPSQHLTGYQEMRTIMETEGGNFLLLLGTGWGLTDEMIQMADFNLRPIYGRGSYNHLSVRSAASIMLDRLLGEKNSR